MASLVDKKLKPVEPRRCPKCRAKSMAWPEGSEVCYACQVRDQVHQRQENEQVVGI
jgi:hypothetical protein